ncbi:MAG TPA: serine hydrolase domain-containing protein [Thermotogota bacterium]|nr:serine hydrolase domain-containing protein [Thermotogota bacterium]
MTKNQFSPLTHYLDQMAQLYRASELAVVLTDGEQDVYHYGPVDGPLFGIGSVGKTFTATALMAALDDGLLHLSDPVTQHLPWFQLKSSLGEITLHHLLTHTASIITESDLLPDPFNIAWELRETHPVFAPGEAFRYSDVGYKILGLVLEAVYHQPYARIVQGKIFEPLGMVSSQGAITNNMRENMACGKVPFHDDRPSSSLDALVPAPWLETSSGDGCIASTATDMARFVRMLLQGGKPVLSESAFTQMTTPHQKGDHMVWGDYGYGIYVFRDRGQTMLGHGGDQPGYDAFLFANPQAGIGGTMLCATPYPQGLVPGIIDFVHSLIDPAFSPDLVVRPDFFTLDNPEKYTGTFHSASTTIQTVAKAKKLFLHVEGKQVPLEDKGWHSFLPHHPDWRTFVLEFPFEEDGSLHRVTWGPEVFRSEPREQPTPTRDEWKAFTGHYRCDNPWHTNFRIILRQDELFLVEPDGEPRPLFPLEESLFQLDEKTSPDRIRFERVVEGKAMRAVLNTMPYGRTFTP